MSGSGLWVGFAVFFRYLIVDKKTKNLIHYSATVQRRQKEAISILRSLTHNTTQQEKQLILFMDEFPLFDKTS